MASLYELFQLSKKLMHVQRYLKVRNLFKLTKDDIIEFALFLTLLTLSKSHTLFYCSTDDFDQSNVNPKNVNLSRHFFTQVLFRLWFVTL